MLRRGMYRFIPTANACCSSAIPLRRARHFVQRNIRRPFRRCIPAARCLNAAVSSYAPSIYYAKANDLIGSGLQIDEIIVYVDVSDVQDEAIFYRLDENDHVREGNFDETCHSQEMLFWSTPWWARWSICSNSFIPLSPQRDDARQCGQRRFRSDRPCRGIRARSGARQLDLRSRLRLLWQNGRRGRHRESAGSDGSALRARLSHHSCINRRLSMAAAALV
jgi:hypothetical protein